ncbi:hypothetical protein AVEN_169264-1 [Araneus ventricosus]|uniref:Uncharacterized protein n=1 Tax=Araneus ventricosus TaxID=182803 RepID=A0A4Y2PND7_ARAVE|nr:hypothetical protein AVEN_169264-1 [Araneus ventricosus]
MRGHTMRTKDEMAARSQSSYFQTVEEFDPRWIQRAPVPCAWRIGVRGLKELKPTLCFLSVDAFSKSQQQRMAFHLEWTAVLTFTPRHHEDIGSSTVDFICTISLPIADF